MAITISELTSAWSDTDATSYAIASTTPAANSLLVLFYTTRHGTTAPGGTPGSDTFGGTWVESTAEQVDGISALGCWTNQLGASPGSSGITLSMDGAVTAIGAGWHLLQVSGAATSSPLAQAIYGPTGTTGTTGSPSSAPALADANDAQLLYCHHRTSEAQSAEAGWTAATSRTGAAPNMGVLATWKIAAYDSTPTQTWTTSSRWQAMYLEIKIAGAVAAATGYRWRRNRDGGLLTLR